MAGSNVKSKRKSLIVEMLGYRAQWDIAFSTTQLANNMTIVETLLAAKMNGEVRGESRSVQAGGGRRTRRREAGTPGSNNGHNGMYRIDKIGNGAAMEERDMLEEKDS